MGQETTMTKKLSFKDFTVVQSKPGEDELINYKAQKRRRGAFGATGNTGESVEKKGPCGKSPCNCDKDLEEARLLSDADIAKMVAKQLGNKKNTDSYDQVAAIKAILNKLPKQKSLATDREFIDDVLTILFNKYKFKKEDVNLVSYFDMAAQVHEGEDIDEVLNMAQRRKAAINLKKNKAKIAMGRKRNAKKIADPARLKVRAQKAARREIAKKLTKGIPKSELTPARRAEIEKRLNKMKGKIDRIAKKSLPQVRRDEIAKKRGNKDK
jgi:hypothetical protein